MISVVVVYNDAARFETMLRASLERQRSPYQLVAIDNVAGRFASAAAALNAGGREATGEFLLFIHQDVSFESPGWLHDAETQLQQLPRLGIAGVAGARAAPDPARRVLVSNIEDSVPPQRSDHVGLTRAEIVDTVDECAFFVPRGVFAELPFDEETCDGWHLYAVDYSLRVRASGRLAYVLPLPVYHASGGAIVRVLGFPTLEAAYFRTLRRVIARHGAGAGFLYTTCGAWSTRTALALQRFPPAQIRQAVTAAIRQALSRRR
jgi:hypothetical protein